MRKFIVMLAMMIVYWLTCLLAVAGVSMMSLSFVLFFETPVGVVVIMYLIVADYLARLVAFPISVLAYIAIVALGCAAYLLIAYAVTGRWLAPTGSRLFFYWVGYLPVLTTAAFLLMYRITRQRET